MGSSLPKRGPDQQRGGQNCQALPSRQVGAWHARFLPWGEFPANALPVPVPMTGMPEDASCMQDDPAGWFET